MAAATCAYGYERSRPLMPAAPTTPAAMGSPTPARSSQVMEPLDNDGRGHAAHGSIHGAVTPPPPTPPLLLGLHLGARSNPSSSKATSHHLGLCTEGLGSESSESSGDVDLGVVVDDIDKDAGVDVGQALPCKRQHRDDDEVPMPARARTRTRSGRAFPPPISVIGAGGKPWLYLRAHRGDGRLVLREVRIPSRELLQACREDGRFKLQFAHPEEEPVDDQWCQGQEAND